MDTLNKNQKWDWEVAFIFLYLSIPRYEARDKHIYQNCAKHVSGGGLEAEIVQ